MTTSRKLSRGRDEISADVALALQSPHVRAPDLTRRATRTNQKWLSSDLEPGTGDSSSHAGCAGPLAGIEIENSTDNPRRASGMNALDDLLDVLALIAIEATEPKKRRIMSDAGGEGDAA
jgi:hypothetical protein